jgi:UDP-glucose-4-epimerase GalE
VKWGPLIVGDLADPEAIRAALRDHRIEAVVHFAASAYVGESVVHPAEYFQNNIVNSLNLLNAMRAENVERIVFSSSCATYGVPEQLPLTENHPQRPINPYGESKLFVERALLWYANAYGLKWVALRYFNAAGADPDAELREEHDPETHLIPLLIDAALGKGKPIGVFGTDYQTNDGTAVRDYVHVTDLAEAHVYALRYLERCGPSTALNLGTGRGYSVLEVMGAVERVLNVKVPHRLMPRRFGDPAELVAGPGAAFQALGWTAARSSIDHIVRTACAARARAPETADLLG